MCLLLFSQKYDHAPAGQSTAFGRKPGPVLYHWLFSALWKTVHAENVLGVPLVFLDTDSSRTSHLGDEGDVFQTSLSPFSFLRVLFGPSKTFFDCSFSYYSFDQHTAPPRLLREPANPPGLEHDAAFLAYAAYKAGGPSALLSQRFPIASLGGDRRIFSDPLIPHLGE